MEAIFNNLTKAIGWSILHSLWQGAIIYAILFVALLIWPKMTSKVKHNLAFGSLFLIFFSFCFTFASVFEMPSKSGTGIQQIALDQLSYQDLTKFGNSFNLKTEAYFPLVVTIYAVGIAFQLLMLFSGYLKLKKLKQVSKIAVPADWSATFELILSQLKLNKTVKFYLSPKVNVPLVIGFFKPVVLFPVALATQLDLKQVEAILIHELSHIRRNDYLINLVKTCIETLLFFNPFVWLTTKLIHIEREHACDDLVVNFTGTPLTYAHALLKLELLKAKDAPSLSLAATGKNQYLYQRIKRITDMKTNYMNAKQQFFILTLAIATVVSLAWMNPSKKAAVKAKKEKTIVTLKVTPIEKAVLTNHMVMKSDTDSTKTKHKYKIVVTDDKGVEKIYTSVNDMPDSLKKKVWAHQGYADSVIAKQMAYFNSPEWKAKMLETQKYSAEIAKKFQSKEWKDQVAKIQLNAEEMSKKFQSKEWKEQMAKVQEQQAVLAKKFESKEWKEQMAKVQEQQAVIAKKFESKEWKDQVAKIQQNAEEMSKKFNSPEWKKHVELLQKNAEDMNKKFNSPEWKQKMEDLQKLQESPEYKELRKKYEQDLDQLKKKKGIKTDDKAFLLFDMNNAVDKTFLPATQPFQAMLLSAPLAKLAAIPTTFPNPAVNLLIEKLPGVKMEPFTKFVELKPIKN
jgi:bla regulator protein BlaR1